MADETTPTRTWTEHTSNCRFCYRDFYISREAIDELRNFDEYKDQSDAEIAATMDVCLGCLEGTDLPGEHVSGEQKHPEPERGPHGTWTDPLEGPYWQLINLTPRNVRDLWDVIDIAHESDPDNVPAETYDKLKALADAVKSKGVWPEPRS